MKKDFLFLAGEQLGNMRLTAEGARTLFESELSPLYHTLMEGGQTEEAIALDAIGTALNTLEQQIHDLQLAYTAVSSVEK